MDIEFSWMTYFVSLFMLVVLSIALSLLCPPGGHRRPTYRNGGEWRPDREHPH